MSLRTTTVLPPIVLEQQRSIGVAMDLARGWDAEAARLLEAEAYTRIHGTSMVADRYAARAAVLTGHAAALRSALS